MVKVTRIKAVCLVLRLSHSRAVDFLAHKLVVSNSRVVAYLARSPLNSREVAILVLNLKAEDYLVLLNHNHSRVEDYLANQLNLSLNRLEGSLDRSIKLLNHNRSRQEGFSDKALRRSKEVVVCLALVCNNPNRRNKAVDFLALAIYRISHSKVEVCLEQM